MDEITLIRVVAGLIFVTLLLLLVRVLVRQRNRLTTEGKTALDVGIQSHWKSWILVACVFVVYMGIFSAAFHADSDGQAVFPSLAATVLTVFIYKKISRRV